MRHLAVALFDRCQVAVLSDGGQIPTDFRKASRSASNLAGWLQISGLARLLPLMLPAGKCLNGSAASCFSVSACCWNCALL
ncbi:hypothetical protein BI344_09950 [Chromobacterium sphagni]|uniref:Uncharacterized protein n=1 Tax=Chromobacterium sphagni TaxID=1903179 RepID=A0ABX3C9V2_9NEIS|nr:hypothetical protein BI344_09950 [Chromobacterium sphagni]